MIIDTIPNITSSPFDNMVPVLRTAISPARKQTVVEVLLALFKRNYNVPELTGLVDDVIVVNDVVTNFVNTFIPESNFSVFNGLSKELVYPTADLIDEWLTDQPESVLGLIDQELIALDSVDLTEYTLTIKKTPKPPLTVIDAQCYSSLQTILAHSKTINSLFCPIFKQLRNRLISVLSPKYDIYTDMSTEDYEKKLTRKFDLEILKTYKTYELDISKFDKSQGELILLIELKIYQLLGMPPSIAKLWYNAHARTKLIDRYNKIKCFIDYQRKSGDASTFFGNTIVTMFTLATAINMHNIHYAVFARDDSLIFSESSFECFVNIDRKTLRKIDPEETKF